MTGHDPVITIRGLSFRYPPSISGRAGFALRTISLSIDPGEFVVVTGHSGSGKSTLARCLNGLIPHATRGTMDGRVVAAGLDTREHDVPDFARTVGLVFQDPAYQIVTSDVESEIAFALEAQNLPEEEIQTRIETTVSLLRIGHLLGRTTADLSWGERQRVAIASVLAARPKVLVMDEPFSGIDPPAAAELAGLLHDLKKETGITIVIFEHRTTWLHAIADRWIAMQDGTVVSDTRPAAGGDAFGKPGPAATRFQLGRREIPAIHPAPVLSLRNVTYTYPGQKGPALSKVSLDFYPGELAVITGPNGSGKTTLLKHCNGLLVPDGGVVLLGTSPLAGKTVAEAARTVGLLGQHADHQLFEDTIAGEVSFGPRNLGKIGSILDEAVQTAIHMCSLSHIDPATPPLGLSGGEKQRVALAGILSMETPVVVLDEPTFGLDPGLKHSLSSLLRTLCAGKKCVILATHDEEFAESCGDRFIRIAGGRIAGDYRRVTETHDNSHSPGEWVIPAGGGDPGVP
ncbi:ABC transporter ATP-binding protein [Methanoregula formicica]|uniref:ATPase component of various ABC-type transport systems with duplicated ATPase domain n=1 Tax=Methanoregula formicica (strain DSM 22288 / NBRC 105244 / SMSP) TaxID=593750 RepID=L0HAM6_METFS|nr:ABC transporter ATP-binding protein [Methanoregula formicica]AGB01787.1 ATPase component of various ABC-type transport systems with duplicated ATPase domain [Methanoregula formicica SMSP]